MAGITGSATDLVTLGPSALVRALAAAVIAGIVSFPRAFLAGLRDRHRRSGHPVQLPRPARIGRTSCCSSQCSSRCTSKPLWMRPDPDVFVRARNGTQIPERLKSIWWVRNLDRGALVLLAVAAIALPLLVTQPSRHLLYTTIPCVHVVRTLTDDYTPLGRSALTRSDGVREGSARWSRPALHAGITFDVGWHERASSREA